MVLEKSRPTWSGKQSAANPDAGRPIQGLRDVGLGEAPAAYLVESNVRFGLETEVASCRGLAAGSTSDLIRLDRHRRSIQSEHARLLSITPPSAPPGNLSCCNEECVVIGRGFGMNVEGNPYRLMISSCLKQRHCQVYPAVLQLRKEIKKLGAEA